MKDWFKKKSNWLTIVIVAYVAWRQAPILLNSFQSQGTILETKTYTTISPTKPFQVEFPSKESKALAIFWATWCGPCKVEMQRLKSSHIDQSKIFAINPFEDAATSRKFLETNDYQFTFIDAPEVTQRLKIELTPTTLFINKGEITSMSTGMSLIGIWKAQWFLN